MKFELMVDLHVPDAEEKESIKMELIEFNKSGEKWKRALKSSRRASERGVQIDKRGR